MFPLQTTSLSTLSPLFIISKSTISQRCHSTLSNISHIFTRQTRRLHFHTKVSSSTSISTPTFPQNIQSRSLSSFSSSSHHNIRCVHTHTNNREHARAFSRPPTQLATVPPLQWGYQCLGERHAVSSATYQANRNNEDRLVMVDTLDGDVWVGVLDGHGGPQVSEFASKTLVKSARTELQRAPDSSVSSVEDALKQGFLNVDHAFIEAVRPAHQLGFTEVRKVGCCALLARLRGNALFVANAGDCRALVGNVKDANECYNVTHDHTAMDVEFQKKLIAEHPNESNVIVKKEDGACYIKGRLMPSRALGDLDLKSMEFAGPREASLSEAFYSKPFTPPYITAVPDVTHYTMQCGSFFVVATDGLWDELSNKEVYDFVQNRNGSPEHCARDLVEMVCKCKVNGEKGIRDLIMFVELNFNPFNPRPSGGYLQDIFSFCDLKGELYA